MVERRFQKRTLFLIAYLVFAILPVYWMLNMSFKTNEEILGAFSLWPRAFTLDNYKVIFTDVSWYSGYINSMIYVAINTVVSLLVALPAAYAFSRYSFLGDKHVFFWLLTNRMTPPAVFLLPFFQLYTTLGLMDTHLAVALAHLVFNVPLAVWILEGFMSGVPREIDETAYIDGYSFPRFFLTIFIPLIKAGVGVAAFFCFMFELGRIADGAHADQRGRQTHRCDDDAHGVGQRYGLGRTGRRRHADHRARRHRHLVRAPLHREGFRDGPGLVAERKSQMFDWMAWTTPVAVFFGCIVLMLVGMTVWELKSPTVMRKGFLPIATTRGDRLFIGLLSAAYANLLFVAFSEKMIEWFSLEEEPSIWIGFVVSMALLALVMRKG